MSPGFAEVRAVGRSFSISASIGRAVSSSGGECPEALLRHADAAMYHVKRRRDALAAGGSAD